jgi:hypothetical protein
MNMNTITKLGIAASALTLAASGTAFAQYGVSTGLNINANVSASGTVIATSTARVQARAELKTERMASTTANKEAMMIQRADKEVQARIDSLNKVIAQIQNMKKVSDADKATVEATIQAEIDTLTSLKAKVDADTSTTSLSVDLKSIAPDYRVYMLFMPQVRIMAAASRINDIASLMTTVQGKLQARISALVASSSFDASGTVSIVSDISAKIADAQLQATNAVSVTSGLKPDNGDKNLAASNTAALKQGQADIKAGNADLRAGEKDLNSLVQIIRENMPRRPEGMLRTINGTTTVNASGTVNRY